MAREQSVSNNKDRTTPKADNGAQAPITETQAPAAEATETAETKRVRGVVPTMPLGVVYRLANTRVVAEIISPKGERYRAEGKGQGSAIGELVDSGFHLSGLRDDGPAWIAQYLPSDITVIGYATVQGFPLPPQ